MENGKNTGHMKRIAKRKGTFSCRLVFIVCGHHEEVILNSRNKEGLFSL